MPSTVQPLYSGAASPVTITLASLANAAYRQSAAINNGSTLYQDALVTWKSKTGASGTSSTGYATLYLYGYDGSVYSNNASGADAGFTPDLDQNLTPLFTLSMQANTTEYYSPLISICGAANLLWLPPQWGLIVLNESGGTFDATAGNHVIEWSGVNPRGT